MAPQLVFAALALACLGVASEPDCNELVKPLADLSSLRYPSGGKWIMYAVTTDSEELTAAMKFYTSSYIHAKHIPDGNPKIIEIVNKVGGKCLYIETNLSAVGDSFHLALTGQDQTRVFGGQFHETCPDCLMWSDTLKSIGSKEVRRLFLFTNTETLTLPNLERFKQQAACLNFRLGLHMGSYTDLCPEEKEERPVKEDL